MDIGILFDGHLMEGPGLAGGCFDNRRHFKGLSGFCLFDGYLMTAETEAATVKKSLTVRYDENRRLAEASQTDAEEIAKLASVEKRIMELLREVTE